MDTTTRTGTAMINGTPYPVRSLTVEVEPIDITLATRTEPDMTWEQVDAAGHYHAWTEDGKLPTLKSVEDHRECSGVHEDDDCDGYTVTIHRCQLCDEVVEPRTVSTMATFREFAPGRKSWTAEVDAALDRRARVSVVCDQDGYRMFGVGQVASVSAGPAGCVSYIIGIGELGRRPA